MIFLAYTSIFFLALRVMVALINLLSRPVLRNGGVKGDFLVSVLVPARDEQGNIPFLLGDLIHSSYSNIEILVYDDHSKDGTAGVVMDYAAKDNRVRLIKGGPLPEGWLGKNHACHQLARQARGKYLLFLDADVRVTPELIQDSLSFSTRRGIDLLSLFPVQVMVSLGEKISVPLINWVLLSLLPLWLTGYSRRRSLSAANGQFMLFTAEAYYLHLPHEKVKHEKVEDIEIMRTMKPAGFHCQTLLSNGQVTCRMYRGYHEALNGFARNVNAFFGNNWFLMALFGVLTAFGPLFVYLAMPLWALLVYLAGMIFIWAIVSVLSRQPVFINILLMPLHILSFWIIMIRGRYKYMTGTMKWKGRSIR